MMEYRSVQSFKEIGTLQCCTSKFSPVISLKALLGEFQSVISVIHRHHHPLSQKPHRTVGEHQNSNTHLQNPPTPPQTSLVHRAGPVPPPHRPCDYFGLWGLRTTEPPKWLNIHKPHICLPLGSNLNIRAL